MKNVFFKISEYSREKICVGVSFCRRTTLSVERLWRLPLMKLFLMPTFIEEFPSFYHQVRPKLRNKDIYVSSINNMISFIFEKPRRLP